MELFGGRQAFVEKLDSLFRQSTQLPADAPPDIAGMVGQYAHGNEPCHHLAYLYSYAGVPYKTQERVRSLLEMEYDNQPNGLAGNEDCGQMSAWYVMSALGFYAVDQVDSKIQVDSFITQDVLELHPYPGHQVTPLERQHHDEAAVEENPLSDHISRTDSFGIKRRENVDSMDTANNHEGVSNESERIIPVDRPNRRGVQHDGGVAGAGVSVVQLWGYPGAPECAKQGGRILERSGEDG